MESLLRRITSTGFRKGLGGSRPWLYAAIVATGMRMLRHLANPEPEVLYRAKVKPGEAFEITTHVSPGRRARRKARRASSPEG
jgi:hypothetical protein